jgi:hypothetical protein
VERYAATIKEVDFRSTCDDVLARCSHLEALANARAYRPSKWLGLSQLHTLRGVDFSDVSVVAIAAALPRLHTLHAGNDRQGHDFGVAEFFHDLLPRLQSFHFDGWWSNCERHAVSPQQLLSLPRLRDLKWLGRDYQAHTAMALPRGFIGAQPASLHGSLPVIAEWLTRVDATCPGSAAENGPLAQVRELWVGVATLRALYSDTARLLRAAPQLRLLTVDICDEGEEEDAVWLSAAELITDPAFAGLVHPRLRHLAVGCEYDARPDDGAADCAFVLQQRQFPRLRRLTLDEQDYPVSLTE